MTVKIEDVSIGHELATKFESVELPAPENLPEFTFGVGLISAQLARGEQEASRDKRIAMA